MPESSWLELLRDIVVRMPERFRLPDLEMHFATFQRVYPNNKNIDAKVRQTLQRLRDQKIIAFLGSGNYRRLVPRPAPTWEIDFSITEHFKSAAQRARVALETWAKFNLWCNSCGNPTLLLLPANTPVADLRCSGCSMEYQVKSKNGRFEGKILGAAFEPMRKRAVEKTIPDYLLIEYFAKRRTVERVDLLRGHEITEKQLFVRKPLSVSAKRANWTGCMIDIDAVERVSIVAPSFLPRV